MYCVRMQVFAAERQMEQRYTSTQAPSDVWRRRAEWALRCKAGFLWKGCST